MTPSRRVDSASAAATCAAHAGQFRLLLVARLHELLVRAGGFPRSLRCARGGSPAAPDRASPLRLRIGAGNRAVVGKVHRLMAAAPAIRDRPANFKIFIGLYSFVARLPLLRRNRRLDRHRRRHPARFALWPSASRTSRPADMSPCRDWSNRPGDPCPRCAGLNRPAF